MASSGFFEAAARREGESDMRDAVRRRRIAAQHILRNYSDLLLQAARAGRDVGDALSSEAFRRDIALSRSIAARVYAAVNDRPLASVTMSESRAVRADVVSLVAALRERGLPVEPEAIVATVVAAFEVVDADFDAETRRWADISDRGSAALTASHATMALMQSTSIYDFRMGADVALGRCVDAVIRVASDGAYAVLGDVGTREDRRSLRQSLLRDMAKLLAARYESTARRTVADVLDLPVEGHAEYFARHRPFETMLERFGVDARAYLDHVARATAAQAGAEAKAEAERGFP